MIQTLVETANMNAFSIRQAVLPDLDKLLPLFDAYRQFYGKDSDPAAARSFLLNRFDHGESVLFIAEKDGVTAGFVQLYPCFSSVSLARTFILNDLFVDAAYRRQGVAKRLIDAASDYAGSLGAVRLTLATTIGNSAAQRLYQASGWKRDEQFYVYHLALPIAQTA